MASSMPNIPGTGSKIPFPSYLAGITESYPNVNRQRIVESSINSRERIDFLPTNMGLNQSLNDRYMEFRIDGIIGSFIDLTSIVLEMSVKVNRGGGAIPDNDHIALVNGLGNTMFKSVTVFLNDKMIESNPIYNYSAYLKLLKSFKPSNMENVAKCGFFHDDSIGSGIKDTLNDDSFSNNSLEAQLSAEIKKDGVNICFPLLIDLASIDMYLLDGVSIRIRLEMASDSWIMNTHMSGNANKIKIDSAKMWLDRVTPHHNAILALNKSLQLNPVQYIFSKSLYKTYVIGSNQDAIMIDQPFGSCIPERLYLMMVDMQSFSGDYSRNPLFFNHFDLSGLQISINGRNIYNINSTMPSNKARIYYESQKSLGLDNANMLSYNSFGKGRSILTFNFLSEDMEDAIPVEVSASMRINLSFASRMTNPVVVILLADTVGLLTVDESRMILCDVRG